MKIFSETRDWGDVRHHEFWGYRKYRHVRTPEKFDGTDRLTPHTQALIVFVDVKERIGVLRLLSASESDNAPRNIDATKWIPPFKAVRSGVWESAFPLDGAGEFGDSGNSVLWLFGWGVVV